MTDVDAVVAGAGLAGLSAARGLVAAQRTVTVPEARDRVVGRNHGAFPGNGVPVETDGITDLAAQARLSPQHLQRRFTAEMGVPPAAYVELVRI